MTEDTTDDEQRGILHDNSPSSSEEIQTQPPSGLPVPNSQSQKTSEESVTGLEIYHTFHSATDYFNVESGSDMALPQTTSLRRTRASDREASIKKLRSAPPAQRAESDDSVTETESEPELNLPRYRTGQPKQAGGAGSETESESESELPEEAVFMHLHPFGLWLRRALR